MPTYGTTSSSTSPVQLELDLTFDHDPRRANRLARLIYAPAWVDLNPGSKFPDLPDNEPNPAPSSGSVR